MTQSVQIDADRIDELLTRGVEEVIPYDELKEALLSGRQLRVKLGIDPTSPDLHIGRAVPLLKLRDFQELGHQIVLIVGDFTAVIGDTSDKESERPMLSRETIEENKKTYFDQAGKILDLSRAEVRYNSEWLEGLTYREIGEHADMFSVADFIARENIAKRLQSGKRVSLREVLYPLMQGYDSVAIQSDVELGGTDQKFNLLAGRTMQGKSGQRPQSILMNPLIDGIDGRKMSSSWGNTIPLTATPTDMYGKVMSMSDASLVPYFRLCTRVSLKEVAAIEEGLATGKVHPKDVKMQLAREIVALYHGKEAAESAETAFVQTFSQGGISPETPSISVAAGTMLFEALLSAGVVASKTESRRLFEEGAISDALTGEKITDVAATVIAALTVKVGKRRFLKIETT